MKPLQFDKTLLLEIAKFNAEAYQLPPLASKIYAYIVFDFEKRGVCFEEFISVFQVSKSSVSSSLKLLLGKGIIKDFTELSERKRFFVLNEDFLKVRFLEIIDKMEKELSIIEQLNTFRAERGQEAEKFNLLQELFRKNIINIQQSLQEI